MTDHNPVRDSGSSDPAGNGDALARRLSGEATTDEAARILAEVAAGPEDQELVAALDAALGRMADDIPMDLDVEGALARVKERAAGIADLSAERAKRARVPARRSGWRVVVPGLAAAAVLAIGLTGWFALRDRQPRESVLGQSRMLATGVGVRDSLDLPDGTRVLLGPMSSVSLSSGFGTARREVVIRGDAWFDVVHDESKPFTVRAGSATIVDVGTRFSVQSENPEGVRVSVTHGSVSLRSVNSPEPSGVILEAGDRAVLQKDGKVAASRGSVTEEDFAWMEGRLVFRDAGIEQVVSSVRRWYGIELRVDPSLMNRHITATFANESADRVLEVLRLVLGAEIIRKGDTATVRPSGGGMRSG